jgi:DNA-binding NtrC family response regulator
VEKFRVLLIDDEEELVSALVERLGYRGVDAEFALNGMDALEKMRVSEFDVIVLDLKLPGMDGTEVLKKIKAGYPHVPVLMITGHGSMSEGPEEKPDEAYDFLAKPINLEDLIKKMQEAIKANESE